MFKTILDLLSPVKEKDERIDKAVKICQEQLRFRNQLLIKYKEKKKKELDKVKK